MIHVGGCIQGTRGDRACWRQSEEISWHPGSSAGVYRVTESPGKAPVVTFFSSVAESTLTRGPGIPVDEEPIGERVGLDVEVRLLIEVNGRLSGVIEDMGVEQRRLLSALAEIAKGEGAFSLDPLTHAENTIENMKAIAAAAIAQGPAR